MTATSLYDRRVSSVRWLFEMWDSGSILSDIEYLSTVTQLTFNGLKKFHGTLGNCCESSYMNECWLKSKALDLRSDVWRSRPSASLTNHFVQAANLLNVLIHFSF